jgi:hypothetical protein
MLDYEPVDDEIEDSGEEKFWTARRIIFTVIVIITLISFLAYVLLSNWVFAPRPQPPRLPTLEYQQG